MSLSSALSISSLAMMPWKASTHAPIRCLNWVKDMEGVVLHCEVKRRPSRRSGDSGATILDQPLGKQTYIPAQWDGTHGTPVSFRAKLPGKAHMWCSARRIPGCLLLLSALTALFIWLSPRLVELKPPPPRLSSLPSHKAACPRRSRSETSPPEIHSRIERAHV